MSGASSSLGDAIKSGAEYALHQKKEDFKKLGFDLLLYPQDDQADPKMGVSNAEMLISNPDVLGVVGTRKTLWGFGVCLFFMTRLHTAKV